MPVRNPDTSSSASRIRNSGKELTLAAQKYLDEHSTEKFSLEKISQALYVNGSYLLRVFKANTGHTLLWYHHTLRCEKAKQMLSTGTVSVSEVGEAVGYVSSSHFAHIFKKITGMTPTEYQTATADWDTECDP